MAHNTTTAPNLETLTEVELFRRFLRAPLRSDRARARSTLVRPRVSVTDTMLHQLPFASDSVLIDSGEFAAIQDALLEFEPSGPDEIECELEAAIAYAGHLVSGLHMILTEFKLLKEQCANIGAGTNDEFRAWTENPTFILPGIEQSEAA